MKNGAAVTAAAATATAGLATGALLFVSLVDVRALLRHVRAGRVELLKAHFSAWWPAGRDMMVPLITAGTLAHGAAFAATGDRIWLASGACMLAIGPYTGLVLGEDIAALRAADDADTALIATRFCNLHHVRTGLAAAAFGIAVRASRRT